MKYFFLSLLILFNIFSQFVAAQEDNKDFYIYQIQLGAFAKKPALQEFDTLATLGILNDKSITIDKEESDLKRFYLGKYVGEETAQVIIKEVQNRDFKGVTLEEDALALEHYIAKHLEYTIQLGSFKDLNILKFADVPDLNKLHIRLQDDMYKIYYGFYLKEETLIAQEIIAELKKVGFEAILVKFR